MCCVHEMLYVGYMQNQMPCMREVFDTAQDSLVKIKQAFTTDIEGVHS